MYTPRSKNILVIFFSCAFLANFSATILDNSVLLTFEPDLISFSTDEADNKVTLFLSSIICAEMFLADLDILNLNLSFEATFF